MHSPVTLLAWTCAGAVCRSSSSSRPFTSLPTSPRIPAAHGIYGVGDEDALNQVLGSAETRAGRVLAFPNVLQHCVDPFRLADSSRPGHRKILVFFLVDPSVTIVSTSDVPPQQPWSATSTMTLEQAREFRRQLMQERKFFVSEHNEKIYEREFSLCEY